MMLDHITNYFQKNHYTFIKCVVDYKRRNEPHTNHSLSECSYLQKSNHWDGASQMLDIIDNKAPKCTEPLNELHVYNKATTIL